MSDGFGSLEKVIVKMMGRVEDLNADEAAVFPIERDEPFGAGRHGRPQCCVLPAATSWPGHEVPGMRGVCWHSSPAPRAGPEGNAAGALGDVCPQVRGVLARSIVPLMSQ